MALNQRDFCALLHSAYRAALTPENFRSSFRRAGIWPVDHTRLTNQPCPRENSSFAPLASVAELEQAVQVMREKMRATVLGEDA